MPYDLKSTPSGLPMQTVRSAARLTGMSEKTIHRRIKDGTLPAYRLGRAIRISDDDLMRLFFTSPEHGPHGSAGDPLGSWPGAGGDRVLQGSACRAGGAGRFGGAEPSTVTQLGMPPRTTLTARWCALADFKTIAEQIVANWPKLTTAQ